MNTEVKIKELIESSVAEILVATQKGLGKQSFSEIVEMTKRIVHHLGVSIIEELVAEVDEQYNNSRDRHSIQMRNNKSRRMLTQLGEVTLRRRLYYDKEREHYFFAVDELLSIERRSRIDTGLKQELVSNATLMSYGKASELSEYKVSRQTVHNIVKQVPKECVQVKPQGFRSIENIYIEADEDHIHLNTGKSAEVKLVYVHEGTVEVCRGRTELINPKYFVSTSRNDDEIWTEVVNYVYSQYSTSNAIIHLSGDGAQWIKNGVDYFPGAKYHLDKFHVYKSITDVSGTDKVLRRAIINALKIKDYERVRELYSIRSQKTTKASERKNVASGLFYLENNFDEIDLSNTYCCAAEGHVSHVLSARLSSRPMGWSISGAERIAKLRAFYFSGGSFSNISRGRNTPIHCNEEKRRYSHIAKKGTTAYNGVATAHVVGLDGITNGLSVILRSILR